MMRVSCRQVQGQLLGMAGSFVPRELGKLRDHIESCPACKAYWVALCADDALLRDGVAAMQPAVARVESGVMRQLAQMQPRPCVSAGGLRLSLLGNRSARMVVAAIIALGLFFLFARGRATMYAQVIDALGKVQTLHLVDAILRDGQWEKQEEIWYDRDVGVAATAWQDGKMTFQRIDNGEHVWMHMAGSDLGRRSRSMGPFRVVADLLQTGVFTRDRIRVAGEDKVAAGTPWKAYSLSNGTDTVRLLVWLDGERRVRAWEKRRLSKEGLWETYRTGTVEYDGELDLAVFKPDFGPGVRIVEVNTLPYER